MDVTSADTPLNRFLDVLTAEEQQFIPTLANDNLGLILRAAINELDWYSYNMSRSADPTSEQQEQFYLQQLWCRAPHKAVARRSPGIYALRPCFSAAIRA